MVARGERKYKQIRGGVMFPFFSVQKVFNCLDRGNYTRIETGKTNHTIITLTKICNALDISLNELMIGFKYKN